MSKEIPPAPAYFPTSADSPLHPPKEVYERVKALSEKELVKTQDFIIPPRSGKAWKVGKGQIWRLSTPEGPQVGDLNIWNQHDPREHFWAARTRQLQGSHMIEGDRLWSNLPFMRPLCGIIRDNCLLSDGPGDGVSGAGKNGGREDKRDERGSLTKWGGRCHDLLGTRCDPYIGHMLTGASYDYHCHSNLVRSILPFGLTEFDVHDVLNVFQITGLDSQGRYFMEASPATRDSFIDFLAEQDLLCALSTCPGGDLSAWGWHQADESVVGEGPDMKSTCRPIRVEVWDIAGNIEGKVLNGWREAERSGYKGCHGMEVPDGER
ncbi:hypothetical protein EK21DRAFT_68766 [Setomelanomma holmii]|uniref:DUF1989 domain-containing protein n=1 Tax=Setomelanomma holmii TaxID=210430 RepID=A0A9P4LKN0_9PLEO|nr:hypothetical protein EK21DRAFT_68766 [Setomelanomma holmii]